jgi:zinc protease
MLQRAARTHLSVRAIAIALVAVLAILGPPVASSGLAKVFDPQTFTLKNGMQVVVIRNPRAAVVTHMVWYKVGAADEPPGQSGIAHYLEHLMFKGTKKLKSGAFSKIVARNGGRENAFTGQDYTGYFQVIASDRLETVMRHEADRMTGLVLSKKIIEPERGVVLEERRSRTDSRPASILWEQARAALFQNHPYRVPIIGWAHEIKSVTRDQIIAFYRVHYRPNNAILVVAGDITAERLKPLAEKYYGVIPARPVPKRVRPMEPPQKAARRVIRVDPRVRQPSFGRIYLAPSYSTGASQHTYALQVLSQILSGGATSRLNRALVVDQKVADSAGAGYDALVVDHATFYVYASPRAGVPIEKVEAAMDAELKKLLAKGVTAEEVARAKQRLRDAAIYARDSLSTGARILGRALAVGRSIADVETWPEKIKAVTLEQVNAAARHVLKRNSSVTAILKPPARKAGGRAGAGGKPAGGQSPAKLGGKK